MFPFPDFVSGVSAAVAGTVVYYNSNTGITAARPVGYKLEVVPTGALLQQGGVAATCRVPIRSFMQQFMRDDGTDVAGKTYAGNSYHPVFINRGLPQSFSSLSAFPDSKVCSGTESCVLIGVPPDYKFEWVSSPNIDATGDIRSDTYPLSNFMKTVQLSGGGGAAGGALGNPYAAMLPSSATDIASMGNFWMPEDTTGLAWFGQGLPANQSYEFRVRVCMELCVSHAGSSYRPFVTPPERPLPTVVDKVKQVVASLPASMPKPDSTPGWWSMLAETATGIGSFVADLGIPVVSQASRVATNLAKRLLG